MKCDHALQHVQWGSLQLISGGELSERETQTV